MAKILLVEDNQDLADSVLDCLKSKQHAAEHATAKRTAMDLLAVSDYDLLILDWNLPDGEGIEILRWYRSRKGLVPVLMLTAKSDITDKEAGFESGADDYLTKPFNMREFAARIDALLRRPRDIITQTIEFRDLVIHTDSHRVFRKTQEIRLLPKEFAVLEFLLRHSGQIFSTEQLLAKVWASDSESAPDAVVTTVKRLRNKIDEPGQPSIIENIRGVGYRITKG